MQNDNIDAEAGLSSDQDQELSEYDINPLQEDPEAPDSIEIAPARGRGRPAIPDQWSQVLSLDGGREVRIKTYLVSTDKLLVKGIPPVAPARRDKQWEPLFFSKNFVKDNPEITLEKFSLSKTKLK